MMDTLNFIEQAKGFSDREKIKLILFLKGIKPNTYIVHKTNSDNLPERCQFEQILEKKKIHFIRNKEKSYEEIVEVNNKIKWRLEGTWVGYDLFKDKKSEKTFKEYIDLLTKNKHKEADKKAGKLYGYPLNAINEHIRENNLNYLKKKYSYEKYYKKLEKLDRAFPFIFFKATSSKDKTAEKINKKNKEVIKKTTPKLFKKYVKERTYKTEFIVDGYSDIIKNGKSIWPKKNAWEYSLITKQRIEGKHILISYFTTEKYNKGDMLKGELTLKYNYTTIKGIQKTGEVKNLHHERKLPLLGRQF